MSALVLLRINQHTKFEVRRFTISKDMIAQNLTSSSAEADKPTQRAASQQTVKFKTVNVTITMPLLLVICDPVAIIELI